MSARERWRGHAGVGKKRGRSRRLVSQSLASARYNSGSPGVRHAGSGISPIEQLLDRHYSGSRLNCRRSISAAARSLSRTVSFFMRYSMRGVTTVAVNPSNGTRIVPEVGKRKGIAETRQDVEIELGVRGRVADARVLPEQVGGVDLVDLRIIEHVVQRLAKRPMFAASGSTNRSRSSVALTRPCRFIAMAPKMAYVTPRASSAAIKRFRISKSTLPQ